MMYVFNPMPAFRTRIVGCDRPGVERISMTACEIDSGIEVSQGMYVILFVRRS